MLAPSASFPAPPEETVSRGIAICNRAELGLATVLVRKDLTAALTRRVHEHLGLELPQGPARSSAGPVSFAAIGPAAWLASCEGGHSAFAHSLFAILGDLAAVADQSDGYAVLRLSGARVRTLLSKLVPLDLDARAFEPGHVATTVAAHIGVILWRLEDSGGSSPQFEVAVRRSFAHCFWHAVLTGALSP
jgi:sarcosine oxidase subunit gamma